jgi:sortase (surface protein transpeptidase)
LTDSGGEEVGGRPRVPRWALILLAPLAVGAAIAILVSGGDDPPPDPPAYAGPSHSFLPIEAPEPKRAPEPKPEPEPEPKRTVIDQRAAVPVEVEVPEVDIAAPIEPLGLTEGGALEVPEDFSMAGWWASGPEPGERGAAVITAHVDSKAGPAAFYALADASPGDEVHVHRGDGSTATFVIDRLGQYPKDDFPTHRVYDKTPKPTLRLITCGGIFDESIGHYRDNVVAYATRKPA